MYRIAPATRYPADPRAVFILTLAVVTGIPLLFARVQPGSLNELLPKWAVFFWGFFLVIGALVTLIGMSRQTVDGIITEQVGSVAVGGATIFYAAGVLLVGGASAGFSAAIIVGFGISCLWRYGQLQSLLSQTQKIVNDQDEQADQ